MRSSHCRLRAFPCAGAIPGSDPRQIGSAFPGWRTSHSCTDRDDRDAVGDWEQRDGTWYRERAGCHRWSCEDRGDGSGKPGDRQWNRRSRSVSGGREGCSSLPQHSDVWCRCENWRSDTQRGRRLVRSESPVGAVAECHDRDDRKARRSSDETPRVGHILPELTQ